MNGKNAAPLYKYLKAEKGGLLVDGIKWNFTKFLVNKQGKVVERYGPKTAPLQIEVSLRFLPFLFLFDLDMVLAKCTHVTPQHYMVDSNDCTSCLKNSACGFKE